MEYNNRKYVIFDISEIDKINFNEVLESSIETLRKSLDETKTFVKWEGDTPQCVLLLSTKSDYLSYDKIRQILMTEEWSSKEDI
jgi:hypothetical protein